MSTASRKTDSLSYCTSNDPVPRRCRIQGHSPITSMKSTSNSIRVRGPTVHRELRHLDLGKSIKFATWNVLTLSRTGYQEAVTREVNRLDIIACLTWRPKLLAT